MPQPDVDTHPGPTVGQDTPMLDALRGRGESTHFLDYLVRLVWKVTSKIPPRRGQVWEHVDVEDVVGEFLDTKQAAMYLAIQDMESDNQLKKWLRTTMTNFVADMGRATLRGRLTRRVERIVNDVDGLTHDKVHVFGNATGAVDPSDTGALYRETHAIPTVTDWWADDDEDPTPGERSDVVTLVRCITDAASGPVLLDDVVDVVARRLSLPLVWNVETINEEATALAAVDDDIPPACAEAAVGLLTQLTDNELAALPHYASDTNISADALGAAIGKGKSTGATVKRALVVKLQAFAQENPDAEGALRHIGREILAGRFSLIGRSDEGTKEDAHG